jgi:8-amino-7-oxononanoate synthase
MDFKDKIAQLKRQMNLQDAATETTTAPKRAIAMKPEFYDFSQFAEYKEFATMEWYYEREQFTKNIFVKHEGESGATVLMEGRELINYSSYNYLGLANNIRVKDAAKRAIDDHGTSTGSGRSITGEVELHQAFEREISKVLGTEDAVLSTAGYSTNAFTIGYLCRSQDLILYDELIHNSALIGCKMTAARRFSFPHNDFAALDRLLAQHRGQYERAFILVEGVYSMDGDIPDIPTVIEIKKRHNAILMVDEAHSMGVIGPRGLGVVDYFGLNGSDIDILYGSMSKAFGTCGGYVAGPKPLVAILKNYAPGILLYGTSPTPANTAAGLEALKIMQEEPERAAKVRHNAAYFIDRAKAAGLNTYNSRDSGVVPIMIDDSETALWLSVKLFDEQICSFPMLYPIVPRDKSRLRFFMNMDHTAQQIDRTIECIVSNLNNAPKPRGIM